MREPIEVGVDEPRSRHRHATNHAIGLVFFASLYTFLYGGGFFGWGPMQLLLEENGSYSWKCHQNNNFHVMTSGGTSATGSSTSSSHTAVAPIVCYEQQASLLNIQNVGVLAILIAPLLGYILDRYRAVSLMYVIVFLAIVAFTTLSIAAEYPSRKMDPLLYVAFLCFGAIAQCTSILSIQAGVTLYPYDDVYRLRVISLLNALFDSGSITYLGLWAVGHALHLSLTEIVLIYAVLAVISFSGGLYYWIILTPKHDWAQVNRDSNEDQQLIIKEQITQTMDVENDSSTFMSEKDHINTDLIKVKIYDSFDTTMKDDHKNNMNSYSLSYVKIADRRPYAKQLLSEPFILLCYFFSMHFVNNSYTLTAMRDFLASLGDDEYHNRYLTIFTMLLPISISGIPCVDYIIRNYGYHVGFQTINILSLSQNCIKLFSTNLNVQIIGFVLFTYLRCFLFCMTLSYVPILVHSNVTGRCIGTMMFICGIMSFINLPLSNLGMITYDGNFFVPNSIATMLTLPCFVAAYRMGTYMEKEKQASL